MSRKEIYALRSEKSRNGGKFSNDNLTAAVAGSKILTDIIEDVLASKSSLARACYDRKINMIKARRSITNMINIKSSDDTFPQRAKYIRPNYELFYCDVFGCDPDTTEIEAILPPDPVGTMRTILEKDGDILLNEKEKIVFEEYCLNGKTMAQIGELLFLTVSRIGQLYLSVVSKIGRSYAQLYLKLDSDDRKKAEADYLARKDELVASTTEKLISMDRDIESVKNKAEEAVKDLERSCNDKTPIEDLNLSVRSRNALRRAGMKTASDIVKVDANDILKLRNIGIKSMNEILKVKNEYLGVRLSGDRHDDLGKIQGA